MVLRKCPSCKEMVGADSLECPRCGVSFAAARVRWLLRWTILLGLIAWLVARYALKVI